MSLIAVGWRSQVGFAAESSYGVSPTNTTYNWVGSFQPTQGGITLSVDQKKFYTWPLDGTGRYPNNILQGPREVNLEVGYNPQDIVLLTDQINNVPTTSHSVLIYDTDINQYFLVNGARANQVQMQGRTNQPFYVDVQYWGQNVTNTAPTGVTFATDPGVTPFYFVEQEVILGGVVSVRPLSFDVTISNNLQRVYQFDQPYIRANPALNATIEGTITFTLQDVSEFGQMMNMSPFDLELLIGTNGSTNYYLECTVTKYVASNNMKFSPGDIVKFDMSFAGENATVHT